MEVETKYGDFSVIETATGLMAEKLESGVQFFLDGRWLPSKDCTMDIALMIQQIEDEYEFQHDL